MNFHTSVRNIQERFYEMWEIKDLRLDLLEKRWNAEFLVLVRYTVKHKSKNKKCKALAKKMNTISNDIRDTMIWAYYNYTVARHKLALLYHNEHFLVTINENRF